MILYKYFPPERLLPFLKERVLRFTPPGDLNDPHEALPILEQVDPPPHILKKALAAATAETPWWRRRRMAPPLRRGDAAHIEKILDRNPELLAQLRDQTRDEIFDGMRDHVYEAANRIGVLSLSAVPDGVLLWSHYAREHTGFVAQFDSSHFFFQQFADRTEMLDICRAPQPVRYTRVRPRVPIDKVGEPEVFLIKAAEWSYEQEWRFGRALADADITRRRVALFRFPAACLTGVIFGCSMSVGTRKRAIAMIRESSSLRHLQVRQALRARTKYGVTIVDLLFDASDVARY